MKQATSFRWRVYIDFDYQGIGTTPNFTTVGDDISSYVKDVQIAEGGEANELSPNVQIGTCSITLDNRSQVFNINNLSSKYYGKLRTGLAIKVELDIIRSNKTVTWFYGVIESINPDSGLYGNREATLSCADFLSTLQSALVDIPLIQNVRSDTLARYVLNSAYNAPKAMRQIDIVTNPSNGHYIEIDGVRITFVTALSGDNQVVIGSTLYETINRLKAAINGDQGAGDTYSTNVDRPDFILAGFAADFYRVVRDNKAIRLYLFGEPSGSTASDLGTNLRNATYTGGFTLATKGAGYPVVTDTAVTLNGSTGYVSIPPLDLCKRSFSVGFWVNIATLSTAYLFDVRGGSGGAISIRTDATGKLFVDIDGVAVADSGATLLATGTWYYVTLTQGYSTLTLYLNGVVLASATVTRYDDLATTSITAGARSSGAGNFLNGSLEKLHLHFIELTQGSVTAIYNSRYIPPGIIAIYRIPGTVGNSIKIRKSAKALPTPIRSVFDSVVARSVPNLWYAQDETGGTSAASKGKTSTAATYTGGFTLAQPSLLADNEDGYAVDYDGISGYMQLPTLALNGASFTFEMVVRFSTAMESDVFHVWVAGLSGQSLLLRRYADGHLALDYAGGGTITTGAGLIFPGVPVHIVIRHDTSTGKSSLWLFGIKVGEASTTGFTAASPAIRFMYSYVGNYTAGRGQQLVHYDRALPDSEIQAHNAATTATLTGGADYPTNVELQTGVATFEIAADQWSPITTNALTALTHIMTSEVGRFYQRRNGTIVLENRQSRFIRAISPTVVTLNNQPEVMAGVSRNETVTSVSIMVTPRDLAETAGVVAEATDIVTVPGRTDSQPVLPGGSGSLRLTNWDKNTDYISNAVVPFVLELAYLDPVTKRKIGVHRLIRPLEAGVDWEANDRRDYTGENYTVYQPIQLDFTVVDQGTTCKVYISNKALGSLYVKLKIRGYKVNYDDQITVTKDSPTLSGNKYFKNAVSINIPLGGSNSFAAAYASYLVALYGVDRLLIKELDFGAQLQVGSYDLLNIEIGDTLRITDDQIGITNELYEVTGVNLSFSGGGDGYDTRPDSRLTLKVRRLDELAFGVYDNFNANGRYDQAYYTL